MKVVVSFLEMSSTTDRMFCHYTLNLFSCLIRF